jgi:predicted DNA-binding protein
MSDDTLNQSLASLIAEGSEAGLPTPDTETPMVSRSLRLPVDLDERLRALAQTRGIGATTLMRQLIEAGVMELDDTAVVPLADVRRALAALAREHAA